MEETNSGEKISSIKNVETVPIYEDHDINKEWIFSEWIRLWKKRNNGSKEKDYFVWLFEYDYNETCEKEERNKKWNFRIKGTCIIGYVFSSSLLLLYLLNVKKILTFLSFPEVNWENIIIAFIAYLVWGAILAGIMKWADVKKFQETWKRHSNHRFQVEMEMFEYIARYGAYSEENEDIDKVFMEKIISIWEGNQKKFSDNMAKEKDISDFNGKIIAAIDSVSSVLKK